MNNNLIKLHINGENIYVCAGHILWINSDLNNPDRACIRFQNAELLVDESVSRVLDLLTSIKGVSVVWGDKFQDPFAG